MPWDHINKAINRSLPLQQPSKAASSHSSICTNTRQRSPGLRKPHLLSCCFYLSLHCISCQDCRSEKPEISLYLCACHGVSKECASGGTQSPAPWCRTVWGRECWRSGGWREVWLATRGHQQSRPAQVRVAAGAQTAFLITSEKPAFLLHSHRTHGGLDLAFPELSSQCPSRHPQNIVLLFWLHKSQASLQAEFYAPLGFSEKLTTSEKMKYFILLNHFFLFCC